MNWHLSVGGFIVGLLIGLTGMGGGSLMTPLLILLFHTEPTVAVGTDLLYASITKFVGAIAHIRQKTIDLRLFKWLVGFGIIGALLGSALIGELSAHLSTHTVNQVVSHLLGLLYVPVIFSMVWRWVTRHRNMGAPSMDESQFPKFRIALLGLLGSFVVGMTSVGSGSIYIAVLSVIYPIANARLVGTDIVQGAVITGVAGLVHFGFGHVDLAMVGSLLVGSIPGILLGSRLTFRMPDSFIRVALMLMLCWSSWNLLR